MGEKVQVAWSSHAPFKGDANEVYAELRRIERTGGVTPEAIVTVARMKSSVLHPLIFDGTTADEALEKYHLDRARKLTTSILIRNEEGEVTQVRAYYLTRVGVEDRVWKSAENIVRDPIATREVQERLTRRLESIRQQLEHFGLYPELLAFLDEVLAEPVAA